jgi:hypothetical protein
MPFFDGTRDILLFVFGAVTGSTLSFGLFDRWRSRRRNANAACARCGQPWAARYPSVERFLVQGREVCEPCATALRRRIPGLMRVLVIVGMIGAGWIVLEFGTGTRNGAPSSLMRWLLGLSGPIGLPVVTLAALAWAKRQNRQAIRAAEARSGIAPTESSDSVAEGV